MNIDDKIKLEFLGIIDLNHLLTPIREKFYYLFPEHEREEKPCDLEEDKDKYKTIISIDYEVYCLNIIIKIIKNIQYQYITTKEVK